MLPFLFSEGGDQDRRAAARGSTQRDAIKQCEVGADENLSNYDHIC